MSALTLSIALDNDGPWIAHIGYEQPAANGHETDASGPTTHRN